MSRHTWIRGSPIISVCVPQSKRKVVRTWRVELNLLSVTRSLACCCNDLVGRGCCEWFFWHSPPPSPPQPPQQKSKRAVQDQSVCLCYVSVVRLTTVHKIVLIVRRALGTVTQWFIWTHPDLFLLAGSSVAQLKAVDPEGEPLIYGVSGEDAMRYFSVNKDTGVVWLRQQLDREVQIWRCTLCN